MKTVKIKTHELFGKDKKTRVNKGRQLQKYIKENRSLIVFTIDLFECKGLNAHIICNALNDLKNITPNKLVEVDETTNIFKYLAETISNRLDIKCVIISEQIMKNFYDTGIMMLHPDILPYRVLFLLYEENGIFHIYFPTPLPIDENNMNDYLQDDFDSSKIAERDKMKIPPIENISLKRDNNIKEEKEEQEMTTSFEEDNNIDRKEKLHIDISNEFKYLVNKEINNVSIYTGRENPVANEKIAVLLDLNNYSTIPYYLSKEFKHFHLKSNCLSININKDSFINIVNCIQDTIKYCILKNRKYDIKKLIYDVKSTALRLISYSDNNYAKETINNVDMEEIIRKILDHNEELQAVYKEGVNKFYKYNVLIDNDNNPHISLDLDNPLQILYWRHLACASEISKISDLSKLETGVPRKLSTLYASNDIIINEEIIKRLSEGEENNGTEIKNKENN